MGNEIFSTSTCYSETIKSFLKKVKEIPGFTLPKLEYK